MIDPKEIDQIARSLREHGVEYIKTSQIEMKMAVRSVPIKSNLPVSPEIPPISKDESDEIKHTDLGLSSVMKLSDHELVDMLFPEPKEDEAP